ncbi:MAG: DUF6122 family protein [Planctomycetota bacterium]
MFTADVLRRYAPQNTAETGVIQVTGIKILTIHILLHFLVPLVVVIIFFRHKWCYAYLIMVSTMLVDIDHLLANPIYDPNRCSICFHPLHSLFAVALYAIFCFIPKTRIMGIGLLVHMALDSVNCQITNSVWFV